MYEGSVTVVRSAVEMTDAFEVEVELHQGSALNFLLFAMVMDILTDMIK